MSDSTRGTARSDLNNEEWKHNDKGETILEYLTYGSRSLFGELSIEEFICPLRYGDGFLDRRTTEACECMVKGIGCSKIKECKAYEEQKKLQEIFPMVKWNNPVKEKEEIVARISLIKKGAIILPKGDLVDV